MTEPLVPVASDGLRDWVFDALGTQWTITTAGDLPSVAVDEVIAELDRIDRAWSRFRDDSMVARAARRTGRFPFAATDQPLLDWYRRLYDATDGAVSPFVGQTLVEAGYDADYTLTPATMISGVPAWDTVLRSHVGVLEVIMPALIDVGAAGKGFAVDRVARIVASHAEGFIVDGSGDMVISAREVPVRIALEHPDDPTIAIGVVELAGGAVCASATTRRSWADWHHVIDGRTGKPAADVVATWAVADSAMIADGLATALFFTPARRLHERLGVDFGYVTLLADGTAEHARWPGLELFT